MAGRARIHGVTPNPFIGRLYVWGYSTTSALGGNFSETAPAWRLSSPTQIGSAIDWRIFTSFTDTGMGLRSGKMFLWGSNGNGGMVGDGTITNRTSPVLIGAGTDWSFVGSGNGNYNSLGVRSGKLFAWGANSSGQLNTGDTTSRSSPVQIGAATVWVMGANSGGSIIALREGKLFSWGYNGQGQLGDGTRTARNSPVQLGAEVDWTWISAGYSGCFHGLRDGKLFGWGYNGSGTLGLGDSSPRSSPVQVGAATDWTAIAGGASHTLGIRGGKLFAWGSNSSGQLGQGNQTDRNSPVQVGSATNWTAIAAGSGISFGIRDGVLFSWGRGNTGSTGQAGTAFDGWDLSSPVQIGSYLDWKDVKSGDSAVHAIR
jgi:alpha-tubulin suppressor-like RCC1 family protein